MKVKLNDILEGREIIQDLMEQDVPIRISHRLLTGLIPQLNEHYQYIESNRVKLVEKYGTKNEEGLVQVDEDQLQEFAKEWLEFLQEEIEIEWDLIPTTDLGEKVNISVVKLSTISFMFSDL